MLFKRAVEKIPTQHLTQQFLSVHSRNKPEIIYEVMELAMITDLLRHQLSDDDLKSTVTSAHISE